jgi:hypothetical protein
MNKKVLIASIFATLMLLIPINSVVGVSDVEEDCGCEDRYSNILEFSEKYQKLLDFVKLDKSLNPSMSDNCIYLLMKFMNEWYLSFMYTMIGNLLYPQYRNLADKFYRLGDFYIVKAIDTILYAAELGCKWADWVEPEPPPHP